MRHSQSDGLKVRAIVVGAWLLWDVVPGMCVVVVVALEWTVGAGVG